MSITGLAMEDRFGRVIFFIGKRARPTLLVAGLCCVVSGCISISVTGQSTAQMKRQVEQSLFYKSMKVFYPGETANKPRPIGEVTPQNLKRIETDFSAQLDRVLQLHGAHRELMVKLFGENAAATPRARVALLNRNLAEAQTFQDGEIDIDIRVVHALLQSAVLTVYGAEVDLERIRSRKPPVTQADYSPEEEKLVINHLLTTLTRLEKTEGRSVLGDLMHTEPNAKAKPTGELDWFEMSRLLNELNGVAVRFDTQVFYLLAHEVGHLVLGHFSDKPVVLPASSDEPLDECSGRRAMERAADAYAVTLLSVASGQQATADVIPFEAAGSVPLFRGLDTFFKYAYGYAGFESRDNEASCKYPSPAERLKLAQSIYKGIRDAQIKVIFEKAKREQ